MEIVTYKGLDITKEILKPLYELNILNMKKVDSEIAVYSEEVWSNNFLNNETQIVIIAIDDDKIAGFALMDLRDRENYVNDIQINEAYQKDGTTFNSIIKKLFENGTFNLCFTGKIWKDNQKAKDIFKKMGVYSFGDNVVLTYENAKKWVEAKN